MSYTIEWFSYCCILIILKTNHFTIKTNRLLFIVRVRREENLLLQLKATRPKRSYSFYCLEQGLAKGYWPLAKIWYVNLYYKCVYYNMLAIYYCRPLWKSCLFPPWFLTLVYTDKFSGKFILYINSLVV